MTERPRITLDPLEVSRRTIFRPETIERAFRLAEDMALNGYLRTDGLDDYIERFVCDCSRRAIKPDEYLQALYSVSMFNGSRVGLL